MWEAAFDTRCMAMFQPALQLSRSCSIGILACEILTAAHAAARLQTAVCTIGGVRFAKVPHASRPASSRLRHTTRVARPGIERRRTVCQRRSCTR